METIEPSDSAFSDPAASVSASGVSASKDAERTPNFLLVRDSSGDWPRWKQAAVGSAVFHLFAITALFVIRGGPYEIPPPERLYVPYVTHLYVPKELTQKAPNKGPVVKVLTAPAIAPAPKMTEPPAPRKAAQVAPPQQSAPAPKPQVQPPAPAAPPPVPTQTETARNPVQAPTPPPAAVPKPDAPKLIVADSIQKQPPAQKPTGIFVPPASSVQEAMRTLANGVPSAPRNQVGDSDEVGVGAGLNLPPSAARPRSNLQLKSDPMGVDFKPYLLQVLQAVRTNWFSVFPTAARLGMRGQTVLEFILGKDGHVIKVVNSGPSGARPLDEAAVAAISMSSPLPALPKEFKGDTIVLQMSFMYNLPR
jgi:TonB family protein